MYSHQNFTPLTEVGPTRHQTSALYNQLQRLKNVLKGCANHRENKAARKQEVR